MQEESIERVASVFTVFVFRKFEGERKLVGKKKKIIIEHSTCVLRHHQLSGYYDPLPRISTKMAKKKKKIIITIKKK